MFLAQNDQVSQESSSPTPLPKIDEQIYISKNCETKSPYTNYHQLKLKHTRTVGYGAVNFHHNFSPSPALNLEK